MKLEKKITYEIKNLCKDNCPIDCKYKDKEWALVKDMIKIIQKVKEDGRGNKCRRILTYLEA